MTELFGEGESASLITLTPIDDKKNAEIMVITFPDKADVFLDDNPDGQSPVLLKDVTESDHELRLNKQNFIEKSLRIRATKGFLLKAVVYLGAVVFPDLSQLLKLLKRLLQLVHLRKYLSLILLRVF